MYFLYERYPSVCLSTFWMSLIISFLIVIWYHFLFFFLFSLLSCLNAFLSCSFFCFRDVIVFISFIAPFFVIPVSCSYSTPFLAMMTSFVLSSARVAKSNSACRFFGVSLFRMSVTFPK